MFAYDYSRTYWAAAPATSRTPLRWADVVWTVVHHPGSDGAPLGTDPARIAQALRGWQRYHQAGRGWSDMAYSVGVDQAGRLWELRGLDVREGGTSGWGGRSVSILAIRRNGEPASDAMKLGILRVQAEAARRQPRVRHTHHGRLVSTSCPGSDLTAWSAAGFPPPASSTTSKETDMEIKELIDFRVDGRNLWDSLKDIRALADQAVIGQASLQEALVGITKLNATLTRLSQQLEQQPAQGVEPGQVVQAVRDAVSTALTGATITLP